MAEGQSTNIVGSGSKQSVTYRKDYRPADYQIDSVALDFDIYPGRTSVKSVLQVSRNPLADSFVNTLPLNGEQLTLKQVKLDGETLGENTYQLTDSQLTLYNLPEKFELEIVTEIDPSKNLALEGLYLSDGMYCTQCEAEGFRRITYYLDRPDVMAVFSTRITADKKQYPVLLSNGNLLSSGDLPDGRHWVEWHDPFKKPCYLFALVAGDLAAREDSFITLSGRNVELKIYVEEKDLDKCDHAMASLKNAMRWDEEVYGCEYDLDLYMIVAVDFFNMGAMENKGLNIFNTSCVLAHPSTQTDAAFQRVEAVVAHEYFHNWSGNRVTCRDWFQLSLKEGFTVFRDASFSADMNSATVKRIEDVSLLRTAQFAEDAGPLSHPVRPESYIEISNFYTLTIYEKGAEVIHMMHQLLGAEQFRRGSDLYFERHDGQAATCEDFVVAMEEASGHDLTQFRRWYSQSGTPVLDVQEHWDDQHRRYSLTFEQSCPPTPAQPQKDPFVIPVSFALIGPDGLIEGSEEMLVIDQQKQQFHFDGLADKPVPSLLRGFSAPVILRYEYQLDELLRLMTCEQDGFVRWDASGRYIVHLLKQHLSGNLLLTTEQGQHQIEIYAQAVSEMLSQGFTESKQGDIRNSCWDQTNDAALLAEILRLPSYQYLAEQFEKIDIIAIQSAMGLLRAAYTRQLQATAESAYTALQQQLEDRGEYRPHASDIALRSLKNGCLELLLYKPKDTHIQLAVNQFGNARNMTDQLSALSVLINSEHIMAQASAQELLDAYYAQWQTESLVVNQWLSVQVGMESDRALKNLRALTAHPGYDATNPNKVRALVGAFCARNLTQFHAADGSGYKLLVDEVQRLNAINPQLAARLITPLTGWRRYTEPGSSNMRAALQTIVDTDNLSADVFEIASKALAD